MSPLEVALVILVSIWTLIFVIIAIAMVVLLIGIKKAMDKINSILTQGEDVAKGFGSVGRAAQVGLSGLLARTAGEYFKRSAPKKAPRKTSKRKR